MTLPVHAERKKSARTAGLRYVPDAALTLQRARNGKGFVYLNRQGRRVRNETLLSRIKKLAIPPAWTDVRISPDPKGHLQAVGRDARGRKQYRYHARWSATRNENKFDRLAAFGRVLPKIRREIARQMRQPGLPRDKVLAAVVRLLELSAVRVGNEEYATQNGSYGLTTLRNRHARVNGTTITLQFRGKSGKEHNIAVEHPALARVVRKCQNLPGQKLFEYVDADGVHPVRSEDVNDYIGRITGQDFTAKEFRTWTATVLATAIFSKAKRHARKGNNEQTVMATIKDVARSLGNTPAICRKCYIHPLVINSYLEGSISRINQIRSTRAGLNRNETLLVRILAGR